MTTAEDELARLRFPIGPFKPKDNITTAELHAYMDTIASAPAAYRTLTQNLSEAELRKTYRPGSWDIQQLVNHVADMQLLHFFRMKRALTEPDYHEVTLVNQDAWTQTADGLHAPVEDALQMMEGITKRYVYLMRSLDEKQLDVSWYHPIRKITLNQRQAIAMTEWHVRHHVEHIRIALEK